ncbi:MAG: helix-turn-helix domain-containing protein [Candidatus Eisenbacteria bacterium]|nr:helix-turn-helix domain-containing protein [Candidatus Eisenbacteria bacterium]
MISSERQIERLLTVREVCEVLHIGKTRVYAMAASGELPAVRIGSALRFRPEQLRRWLETQEKR